MLPLSANAATQCIWPPLSPTTVLLFLQQEVNKELQIHCPWCNRAARIPQRGDAIVAPPPCKLGGERETICANPAPAPLLPLERSQWPLPLFPTFLPTGSNITVENKAARDASGMLRECTVTEPCLDSALYLRTAWERARQNYGRVDVALETDPGVSVGTETDPGISRQTQTDEGVSKYTQTDISGDYADDIIKTPSCGLKRKAVHAGPVDFQPPQPPPPVDVAAIKARVAKLIPPPPPPPPRRREANPSPQTEGD